MTILYVVLAVAVGLAAVALIRSSRLARQTADTQAGPGVGQSRESGPGDTAQRGGGQRDERRGGCC